MVTVMMVMATLRPSWPQTNAPVIASLPFPKLLPSAPPTPGLSIADSTTISWTAPPEMAMGAPLTDVGRLQNWVLEILRTDCH